MDDNEEFHSYIKDGKECFRHRPDVAEEVEKFLLKPFSEAENRLMVEALGEKYAANWASIAEKERKADFERYGSELEDMISDARSCGWYGSETDWNWSAFAEDVAKTLAVKVSGAMENLPKKYGYTTPWVISTCGNLAMIEKVCAVN